MSWLWYRMKACEDDQEWFASRRHTSIDALNYKIKYQNVAALTVVVTCHDVGVVFDSINYGFNVMVSWV